jgi:hypothetical protein
MTWSRATAIAGSAVVTLASYRIWIVLGRHEPPLVPKKIGLEVPATVVARADEVIGAALGQLGLKEGRTHADTLCTVGIP